MSDFIARQPIAIHDGTDERGLVASKAIYLYLTDGVETASINANNQLEVAVGNSVTVVDGGGSITVDGAVTVSASDLDIRSLSESQDSILVYGNDGTTNHALKTDADGNLQVDIVSGAAAGHEYQDGDAAADTYGRMILGTDGTNLQVISVDSNGRINVNIVDSLPAGSNNIGDVDVLSLPSIPAGSNNIGDVDVLSLPSIPTGTNSIGDIGTVGAVTSITNVVHIDDNSGSITVDGSVAATQSGAWNIGTVSTITNPVTITDGGNIITVDGTVIISDGGGSITVDGAVTVSATNLDIRDLTHTSDSVKIGDGTEFLSIDTNGFAQIDIAAQSLTAIKISKDGNANSASNPIYVQQVNQVASATEINDYQTTASVLKNGGTTTHTYTVTSGKTLIIDSISVAASGKMKYTIKVGTSGSEVVKKVGYTSASNPDYQYIINGKIEVVAGDNVLIILQNDDNTDMDVHSTLLGNEV